MKNWLKLDHEHGRIIMDRTFEQKSLNTMTAEYAHLQSVRRDYPTYTVIRRQIKKNPHKECYRGLTYAYMRTYIQKNDPAAEAELDEQLFISECHSSGRRYPTIKKWFLDKYPAVMEFGMTEIELGQYRKALEEKQREMSDESAADAPQSDNVTNIHAAEAPAPEEKIA